MAASHSHSPGLLITRPRELAEPVALKLERLGGRCWVFPTLEIIPITPDRSALELAAQADWWIFISANAVARGWPAVSTHERIPSLAAVGIATARRLEQISERPVLFPPHGSDSEALLACPELGSSTPLRISIFRGAGGREWLKTALESRGHQVNYIECYERQIPLIPNQVLDEAIEAGALVNVQSAESLSNLWSMAQPAQRRAMTGLPFLVSHPRVAECARALGISSIAITKPGDDALIDYWLHWSELP